MGFVLDSIIQEDLLVGPETIDTSFSTDYIDISGTEDDFSVNFVYDSGSSVDMTLYLQVSNDGTNFVDVGDSDQVISDNSGTHLWDIASTGAIFLRVRVEVRSGSIDIQRISFSGKRRH